MSARSGTRSATEQRFAERAAAARRRRVHRWLVLSLALVLVAALAWLVGFSTVLDTRRVEVSGADPADRRAIEEIAEREVGTPLARVSGGVGDRIVDQVPGAAQVDVSRGWPHTLKVNVTSRVPALAVRRAGEGFRLLDIDGVAIRTVKNAPKGVPTVAADEGATVSGRGVQATRGMLKALPEEMSDRVRGVTVDDADQITFTLGGTKVVWGDGSDPDLKVKVIPILLEKKPGVIDVSAPDTPVTRG